MKTQSTLQRALQALLITGISIFALVAALAEDIVQVTADNYVRAESDFQMKSYIENFNCFGKLHHSRKPYDVNNQVTVRGNRDTLYSFGVFDLMSPLTVTLSDTKGRYQSLMIVSQDHSISVVYGPEKVTLTRKSVGTRYVLLTIRTFMDPNDEVDLKEAYRLQDAVDVEQADIGKFEVPNWKKEEVEQLRDTINVVASTVTDTSKMFGKKEELDTVYWMLGAALGWGGLPAAAATYVNVVPEKNDGKTPYTLTVKDVPVDATTRAGCRSTSTKPTPSTTSRPRRTKTAVSPSTSGVTPSSPTSCLSCRAGITS